MKAMIFAAGLGTRLKPFTDTMPKALFPVCGRPLLWHVINKLSSAGITEIVVNVHHYADKIEKYLDSAGFEAKIVVSDERERLLDTGGGVLKARKLLSDANGHGAIGHGANDFGANGHDGGRFIVHNVDILSNLDLTEFVSSSDPDALAVLAVSSRKSSRYLLFDEGMTLVGWMNEKTGEVRTPFDSLDLSSCRRYAFSGIHLMSEKIFDVMEEWHKDDKFSVIDFYIDVAARYPIKAFVKDDMQIVDVGKPESLSIAEMMLGAQCM